MRHLNTAVLGILMVIGISLATNATVQRPDILIYDGKGHDMYAYPLEQFFKVYPEARIVSEGNWSNLWRGYVGTFEIKDGTLLVRDIKILVRTNGPDDFETELVSVMANVFPEQQEVLADWFSGYLIVPAGEEVDQLLWDLIHSKQIIYEVLAGKIIGKREMGKEEYIEYINARWEAYRRENECARIGKECHD